MSLELQIGGVYDIVDPNINELIDLGYTEARVYYASSQFGTYNLTDSIPLVADTFAYSHNNTSALATDWAQHSFYGASVGETARSVPSPLGQPRATKAAIRQGVGRRLQLMKGPYSYTATDSDTIVCASLIDPDGDAVDEAGKFFRVGTQSRRARAADAATPGFVPSTGTINVGRAYSPTLDGTGQLEVWMPRNREDPSVIVDEAMERARKWIWAEDVIWLALASQQTEYALPRAIKNKRQIKKVEIATHQFPNLPVFYTVDWELSFEAGVPTITLGTSSGYSYHSGRLVKVTANMQAESISAETDYWNCDISWAISEVALEAAKVLGAPTSQIEDLRNWSGLKKDLANDCAEFRRIEWPPVTVAMRGPR